MRVHQIIKESHVNGPGKRTVIWVQGCSILCPGCFNPETHSFNGGRELSAEEILLEMPEDVRGITISGGEPFDQSEELSELLKKAYERGVDTLVYTGYTYEKLVKKRKESILTALKYTDILIDGSFEKENKKRIEWTGSSNQRVLYMEEGKVEIERTEHAESVYYGEIEINEEGVITVTGIIEKIKLE